MMDFLKAHPGITKEEYLWEWTIPQIKLASYDSTHVEYLNEEQAKIEQARNCASRYTSAKSLMNDLGMPILGR